MGAATELDGPCPGLHHPDHVAVLVAEEGDGPQAFSLILGGLEGPHGIVGQDVLVGQGLHPLQVLAADGSVVAEVEAEPVGRDERARLLHVRPQHLSQRPVQQVGGGVVAPDGFASAGVDAGHRLLAGSDLTFHDTDAVTYQARHGVGGVDDLGRAGVAGDRARVADLAARLGVERSPVEEHLVADDRQHPALGLVVAVADELGGAELGEDLPVGVHRFGRRPRLLASVASPAPLLLHGGLEALEVGELARQLEREPVGVVELEHHVAGEHLRTLGQLLLEDGGARAQRLAEALLLPAHDAHDEVAVAGQVGVGLAHDLDGGVDEGRRDWCLDAQLEGVAHRSPQDSAQHVSLVLVGREDAVVDEEGDRAPVVGKDAQGHVDLLVVGVTVPGQALGRRHQGA